MSKPRVVLAYSGGLDTSCILRYLQKQGFEVIAFVADVGQKDDFEQVADNARRIGAKDVVIAQLQQEFVTDYIYPAISGNALYEGRYLLGTALARPVIAKHQVQVALEHNAHYVAHGATGKGNDQVRFEFGYAALGPHLKIIAPWKDPAFFGAFKGRSDLIAYAKAEGIDIPVTLKKPFSTDENLMHKSYESGLLEDPNTAADPDMFTVCKSLQTAPDKQALIELSFKDGLPTRLSYDGGNSVLTEPVALFKALNALGAEHGIGRIDIVENRFIGIKSRGVYETPGGTILHAARRDIEGVTMDAEVLRLRDSLSAKFTQLIYNGFWFSPEMAVMRVAMDKCAERVDGTVQLALYKGNVMPVARNSPHGLYDQDLSSMDMEGEFNQADAQGFIHIHALRLKAQNRRRG